MLIETPNLHCFVTGRSAGLTPLNAFDGALLDAGIGNTNLLKVSSIVPPGTREISRDDLKLPPGALVPVAYAAMESDIPGSVICAAVAAAWPQDDTKPGLIMEYHSHGHQQDAEAVVRRMAEAGMEQRGWEIRKIQCAAIDMQVETIGAAFAAVVLWRE
ncbi:MAG: arginine decarboxylase, pyruvoyl-dependent [Pseudomonadota bacterium]|nr:arginine decarboxylase, pyruvoyl-dependent [Pseudomonadota bacterium]